MNVFVVGTGRCGTVTFTKACQHVTNFTAAHESTSGLTRAADLSFPAQHIEVNPHITWLLGPVAALHPDALWVHLVRAKEDVVASWMQRGRTHGPGVWSPLALRVAPKGIRTDEQFRTICELCYDAITHQVDAHLKTLPADRARTILLSDLAGGVSNPKARATWREFWQWIRAEGDFAASLAEWRIRYNRRRSS